MWMSQGYACLRGTVLAACDHAFPFRQATGVAMPDGLPGVVLGEYKGIERCTFCHRCATLALPGDVFNCDFDRSPFFVGLVAQSEPFLIRITAVATQYRLGRSRLEVSETLIIKLGCGIVNVVPSSTLLTYSWNSVWIVWSLCYWKCLLELESCLG
jgi:hypothetical protein